MRGRIAILLAGAIAVVATATSCGEVPTLENGIAYITFTLPSLAVGVGDVLRDSLGNPAPLQIRAFDRSGNEIPATDVSWLATPVPKGNGVTIDANGLVTAGDTMASVQIVGRVGATLQTTPATLIVVPQPDSISAITGTDTSLTRDLPALDTMRVAVTGIYQAARVPVQGILVRYHIDTVYAAAGTQGYAVLTNAAGVVPRPDSTTVVDTTKSAAPLPGSAAPTLVAGSGLDSVVVRVRASRFNGQPLNGSPVRFVLKRR
ncbi:MAG TPA: hypothetical protein VGG84_04275 [Gemmatimonadaceae bacterium]